MRQRRLAICAICSLVGLAMTTPGYVGQFGVGARVGPNRGPIASTGLARTFIDARVVFVLAQSGRIVIYLGDGSAGHHGTWSMYFQPFVFRPADPWKIWAFDAHHLSSRPINNVLFIAFPLWCLQFPMLIAPWLWWRRRAHRRERGFPVNPDVRPAPPA